MSGTGFSGRTSHPMSTNRFGIDKSTNRIGLEIVNTAGSPDRVEDEDKGDHSGRTAASRIWEKRQKKVLEKEKEKHED